MARYETDDRLLERCRAGDSAAWELLVARYRRLVWSIIVQSRLREEDAEDVFQQVFATLVSSVDSIRGEEGLASWLGTTTRRLCWRTSARVRKRESGVRSLESPAAATGNGDDARIDPEDHRESPAEVAALGERQLVREALERLGGKCRELLEALFISGSEPNYTLISEKLGIRMGSIGPTRARCLEKLAGVLGRLGFGGADPSGAGSSTADAEDGDAP